MTGWGMPCGGGGRIGWPGRPVNRRTGTGRQIHMIPGTKNSPFGTAMAAAGRIGRVADLKRLPKRWTSGSRVDAGGTLEQTRVALGEREQDGVRDITG